jgi:hypothetical protein
MSQHQGTRRSNHQKKKFQRWRCHYCGRFGHIKPFCYRLHGYPNQTAQVRPKLKASKHNAPIKKQKWVANQTHQARPKQKSSKHNAPIKKQQWVAKLAHTSPRASTRQDWYFGSGCSRHMTGMSNLLVDMQPHATRYVTFGDGAKGEIKGVGKLDCPGVPKLSNVLLVKGLAANLISISQLYDQGFNVQFTKEVCVVMNGCNQEVMRGARSKDNCYLWESKVSNNSSTCPLAKEEQEVKLWHGRPEQLHLRGMKKIISKEAIRGIPNLLMDERKGCGKCQAGKLTKMSYPKMGHPKSSKLLELVPMHLMVPMQIESQELSSPISPHQTGVVAREKQNCVSLSTAEAKYLASGSKCSPLVWMNQMQTEYNVTQNVMTLDVTQIDQLRGKVGIWPSEEL